MSRILIVDDEQSIGWGLQKLSRTLGHDAKVAATAEAGLKIAKEWQPDVIVLDVRLPGMDGLSAMPQFQSAASSSPIVLITAFGDLSTALKAVENKAFDYVIKPFGIAEIRAVIERALAAPRRVKDVASPSEQGLVGKSVAMQSLFRRIALAASSEVSVLLRGESGSGKELVARAIHHHSSRKKGAFVAVNVAALNSSLVESELFGHVDGAFTGANKSRTGLLAHADGGTLFLDELADIPLPLQVKLLRVLEQGEIPQVGSETPLKSHFRIIAATHQDLAKCVEAGAFRHDLYYRICAFEIAVPPLRDRKDDISLLAEYFCCQFGKGSVTLAEETLEELQMRNWPGNVRELRNAINHACVMVQSGVIRPENLPSAASARGLDSDPKPVVSDAFANAAAQFADVLLKDPKNAGRVYELMLREVEKPLFALAMENFHRECASAAKALGIHRTTLKRKLIEYGINSAAKLE